MERQKAVKGFLLLLLLCAASATATAQGGGKAEPLRIEFKPGAKSATIMGRIRNDEQAEYVFAARQGQRVKLKLTSTPAKSARFKLLSEDAVEYQLTHNGDTWSGLAPATGDHLIYVVRSSPKAGRSSYSLTLKIQ